MRGMRRVRTGASRRLQQAAGGSVALHNPSRGMAQAQHANLPGLGASSMTTETSNARGEWVLVPRVPTEAMKVAALQQAAPLGEIVDWQFDIDDETVDREAVAGIYTAMLAAAPQPPSEPVGAEGLARLLERARG